MALVWRLLHILLIGVAGEAFFKTVLKEVGRTSDGRDRRERALAQLSGVKYKLVSLVEEFPDATYTDYVMVDD